MQASKIMLHHACLVLCSLAQRCSGWGPRGSPPAAELPRHGVAVRGCGLWAQAVAAAHARSPLQLCTHARSEKLQRALLAALQNWGGGSPAGHPHHPKKPSQNPTGTEPSGEGQFRATGSRDGDKDSARFPPGSGYFAAALRFHLFSQPSHVAVAQDPSPEPGTSPYLLLAWSALEERR